MLELTVMGGFSGYSAAILANVAVARAVALALAHESSASGYSTCRIRTTGTGLLSYVGQLQILNFQILVPRIRQPSDIHVISIVLLIKRLISLLNENLWWLFLLSINLLLIWEYCSIKNSFVNF